MDTDHRLEELRELIIGRELTQIERLSKRLDDPAMRAEEVSRIVSEAIILRAGADRSLHGALHPLVEEALRISVARNPAFLATALFPIIGTAVRKALGHALRGMIDSFEQVRERSFSLRGLSWRLEALRTGKNFGEIVLTRSLRYRVEQVFLIHRKTGLLLLHAARDEKIVQDADLVSGMLTAIQDFVHDSFGGGTADELQTMQVGEHTVWIAYGPDALLAGVIWGTAPAELRNLFEGALERIHEEARDVLAQYSGDSSALEPWRPVLESCFPGQAAVQRPPSHGWIYPIFLILLAIGAGWYFFYYKDRILWAEYVARVRDLPGIIVLSEEARGRTYYLSGLRDPLAEDPAGLLKGSGLDPGRVVTTWHTYLSFHPELAKARRIGDLKERLERINIRFPVNSAKIPADQFQALDAAEDEMRSLVSEAADRKSTLRFEIFGHTDSSGKEDLNAALSAQRAEAVHEALLQRKFPPSLLLAEGVRDTRPERRGTTEYDAAANRCVSFRVLWTASK